MQAPLKKDMKFLIDNGYCRDDLADHYGVSVTTIYKWMRQDNLKFPDGKVTPARLSNEDVRHIRGLAEAGLSVAEIRRKFDDRDPKPKMSVLYDVISFKTYKRVGV